MFRNRSILLACALSLGCAPYAVAQHSGSSPDKIVAEYLDGTNKRVLQVTRWPCPSYDSNRDRVVELLTNASLNEAQVQELAQNWSYALRECEDARLDKWFRQNILTTRDGFAALALGLALGSTSNPANLASLKMSLYRRDLSGAVRGEIADGIKTVPLVQVVGWMIEGIAGENEIPAAFLSNAIDRIQGDERVRVREQLLEALKRGAGSVNSVVAIPILVGDAHRSDDMQWKRTLAAELRRIAESSGAAPVVRSTASEALPGLR